MLTMYESLHKAHSPEQSPVFYVGLHTVHLIAVTTSSMLNSSAADNRRQNT